MGPNGPVFSSRINISEENYFIAPFIIFDKIYTNGITERYESPSGSKKTHA